MEGCDPVSDRPPLFAFEHTQVAFGDGPPVLAVDGLRIPDGGVTVVIGPSGAGKSTLLRLCNRLEVASAGTVRYRGDDVSTCDPLVLRRRVGMVFQRPTLFAGTVADNLLVADPGANDAACVAVLDRVGLGAPFLARTADDLSGGEAQRACLARTLLTEPDVLLMDEPTSSLDPSATRVLERLATGLAADGVPVLWVTHDLAQAERIADRTVVLVGGRLADEAEAQAYLAAEHADGTRTVRPAPAGLAGAPNAPADPSRPSLRDRDDGRARGAGGQGAQSDDGGPEAAP